MKMIQETLKESVKYHQISDVKVGSFLSGGVDSSYITALLRPEESFSVGFAYNGFDETAQAAHLSALLGVKNHRKLILFIGIVLRRSPLFSIIWMNPSPIPQPYPYIFCLNWPPNM